MLTSRQREVLILARSRIERGQNQQVCLAIDIVIALRKDLKQAGKSLREYIRLQLGHHPALRTWQLENGINHTTSQRHFDRLAWLDWLLDDWVEHDGGPCPLLPHEKVIVRLRNGAIKDKGTDGPRLASHGRWDHWANSRTPFLSQYGDYDTVAYKVIKEC